MPYCSKCGDSVDLSNHSGWLYCANCGRQICACCVERGCCGQFPALTDSYYLRHAKKVNYVLKNSGEKYTVFAVDLKRPENVLYELQPTRSLSIRNFANQFEWGTGEPSIVLCRKIYGWTPGLRQLAVALLYDFFCREEFAAHHFDKFVSLMLIEIEPQGGVITRDDFRALLKAHTLEMEYMDSDFQEEVPPLAKAKRTRRL